VFYSIFDEKHKWMEKQRITILLLRTKLSETAKERDALKAQLAEAQEKACPEQFVGGCIGADAVIRLSKEVADLKGQLAEARADLQLSIGHSNCYCKHCQKLALKHWSPSNIAVPSQGPKAEGVEADSVCAPTPPTGRIVLSLDDARKIDEFLVSQGEWCTRESPTEMCQCIPHALLNTLRAAMKER
jgi:hypothetical protein